jgi:hypothetical protein
MSSEAVTSSELESARAMVENLEMLEPMVLVTMRPMPRPIGMGGHAGDLKSAELGLSDDTNARV